MTMKFQNVTPIKRSDAEKVFSSKDIQMICRTLVRVAYFDPDWKWVQDKCISFISYPDTPIQIKSLAITCLGHLGRIHHKLEMRRVMSLIIQLKSDHQLSGYVENALDDIKIFIGLSP